MKTYTVKKGDSLWNIAKAGGVSLEAVIAANPQITSPSAITPGQNINIPSTNAVASDTGPSAGVGTVVQAPPVTFVGPGPSQTPDTAASDAAAAPTPQATDALSQAGAAPAPPAPPAGVGGTVSSAPAYSGSGSGTAAPLGGQMWKHVVKHGDSMWKIAKQVGVTLEQLTAANPQITDPNQLQPGQVLNIPSGSQLLKHKALGGQSISAVEIAPSAMPSQKELLTMPKPVTTAPIPTEVPVMEKPKYELPAMEFPKFPSVNLPNINVPSINVPINVQNQANDTIEQKTYNIGPVGNKSYSAPIFQGPVQQGPITQAPISVGSSGVPAAFDPGYMMPHPIHHHPHCICVTVIHCPVCGCLHHHPIMHHMHPEFHHMHPDFHHMHPDFHMHYTYGQPGTYPAPNFAGAQSPVNYGSPMVGSPGEMGPYSYQPYQPTNQIASIHG
ncbi:MAG: hypothetical protein JWN30_720 [Bacilli bacterium]|nr:hypothetical protein [Bacilli bacterium]